MSVKVKLPLLLKAAGHVAEPEYRFHPTRKWRFDYAIVALKVAVEYEGISGKSRHTTLTGYTKDCEKYNAAALLGWRVLRYTAMSKEGQILEDFKQLQNANM